MVTEREKKKIISEIWLENLESGHWRVEEIWDVDF
jgi:hypothetical protein